MAKRRANGEGSIYPQTKDKNGRTTLWAAQYTDNAGKKRTIYGKTQQLAREKLKEAISQSDMGIKVGKNKITLADWLVEWLDIYKRPIVRQMTYNGYYNNIHNHIIPAFPKVLLKDLRGDMLQKFFNEKGKNGKLNNSGGLSHGTLRELKKTFSASLEQAVKNDIIPRNIARDIKLPLNRQAQVQEKSVLTIEEQAALEAVLLSKKEPIAYAIYLTLYTGLRHGEMSGLVLSDIDFDNRFLYVRRTIGRVVIGGTGRTDFMVREPKTAKSKRIIPLPDFVVKALKIYVGTIRKAYVELRECLKESPQTHEIILPEMDFLFLNSSGNPFDNDVGRNILREYQREAGIGETNYHALRHTFATRCIENGFDVKTLSEILGHANAAITLNTYTHALEEQKRTNMDKLKPLS